MRDFCNAVHTMECALDYRVFCVLRLVTDNHYNEVIMTTVASQITSLTIVYSIRLFRRRSKKTSKLRVTGLCAGNSPGPVNSPHKGPVTRKMLPFDDVIMFTLMRRYCFIDNCYIHNDCSSANESTLKNTVIWIHDGLQRQLQKRKL